MKWHIGLLCQSFTSRNIGLWKRKEERKEVKRTRSRNLNKENNRDTGREDGRKGWRCMNVTERGKEKAKVGGLKD